MALSHTQCESRSIICKLYFNATPEIFLSLTGVTVLVRFCQHSCFHGNFIKSLRELLGAVLESFFLNGGQRIWSLVKWKLEDYNKVIISHICLRLTLGQLTHSSQQNIVEL